MHIRYILIFLKQFNKCQLIFKYLFYAFCIALYKRQTQPTLKFPTLETCPDYQEALKEKECLANKEWYKY